MDRSLGRIILALSTLTVVLHVLGARGASRNDEFWGVHVYAFLPIWVMPVATALLLAVVIASRGPEAAMVRRLNRANSGPPPSRRRAAALLAGASLVAGAVFWIYRVRHTFLGDGDIIVAMLPTSPPFHPREPIAAFVNHALFHALRRHTSADFPQHLLAMRAVGMGSVAAGMLFVPVAWGLARELLALQGGIGSKSRPASVAAASHAANAGLLAAALMAQGYGQLFFGYIENYTILLLALGLYLWVALRFLNGRAPFILPACAALLALAVHLSAGMLFPSLGFLAGAGLWDSRRRKGVLRDLGLSAVGFVGLAAVLSRLGHGFDLVGGFAQVVRQELLLGGRNRLDYLLSIEHARDFVQEELLIGPLGLALLLPALVLAAMQFRRRFAAAAGFLAVTALVYLAASWFAGGGNLGYARNWDLLAPAGLVFTVAGFGLLFLRGGSAGPMTAPLVWALALSLYHTVPWIACNMSEERGLARMQVLPLGGGRSEMVVGNYYLRRHDLPRARTWLERSFESYPGNLSACYLLGSVYSLQGETEKAVKVLSFGLELRPTDVDMRRCLISTLTKAGRVQEAVRHSATLVQQPACTVDDWIEYGDMLAANGDEQQAAVARTKALEMCEETYRHNEGDYATNMRLGGLHEALGQPRQALEFFTSAARSHPDSTPASFACGRLQLQLGQIGAGRELLESILRANPGDPMKAKIEALLGSSGQSAQ